MHFTLSAYFQLHFRQFYHGSILYGPWLDCFHQQTELGPYWVTLSGGIRDIAWRQILKWNKQLMIPIYTRLEIVDTSQGDRTIIVPLLLRYRRMTAWCPYDFMGPARASCGDLAGSVRLSQETTIIFGPKWQSKTLCCPHDHRAVIVRCHCDVSTGLRFFQIWHCVKINKIVEARMPVNPYDDRKVSLRRLQGNGDLDMVGAWYPRRKVNVTKA